MTAPAMGGPDEHLDTVNANFAHNWWLVGLRGLLAIIFGVIAFAVPVAAMLSLVLVFAAYSLVDGVLEIVLAIRGAIRRQRWVAMLLTGILGVAAGLIAAFWPGITVLVFITVIAFWAIFSGVLILAAAFDVRRSHGRWWMVLGGVASIAYGVLLLFAPLIGAIVLTWWIGAHAIVLGGTLLVLAYQLRKHRGETPHRAAPARAT